MGGKFVLRGSASDKAVREPVGPQSRVAARGVGSLTSAGSWGWLPALVMSSGLGLVLVAQAMRLALLEIASAKLLFWLGLLLVYAPVALRMALPTVQRRERIALAVWLGLSLYLVKVLRSPAGFIFHDEFPHFATANDILRTGALFHVNSLQEVSAYFPGLEIVTTALTNITGLSLEASGLIVIGAARLVASLGIYLLYEEISGSPRVASIGAVLAITYPNYVFWSSQYSYESLALPLSVLVLLTGLWSGRRSVQRNSLILTGVIIVAAVIMIHHVTSYFLVTSLVALYLMSRWRQPLVHATEVFLGRVPPALTKLMPWTLWRKPSARTTDARVWGVLALSGVVAVGVWLVIAGQEVVAYLWPHIRAASVGFATIFARTSAARAPFTSSGPVAAAPEWEQLLAFTAVLLVVLGIPFGLLQIWRRYRGHAMAVFFGIAALGYPITLVLRMAPGGAEISNRSWDFLFIALGFVLAAGFAELWMAQEPVLSRASIFSAYASLLFAGALIVGMPEWGRLPGPYMFGGDTRGLQAESYAMTDWVRDALGPDNRFIADSTNQLLLGSYGEQYVVDGLSWVYMSPKLTHSDELAAIIERDAQFVVIDYRATDELPRHGSYYENGEPGRPHLEPLDPERLAKFDREPCLSRVYDSGHIIIYAVQAVCGSDQRGTQ